MFDTLLYFVLLCLLVGCMAAGVLLTVEGAYGFSIHDGKLDALCLSLMAHGLLIFLLAASLFASLLMR